MSATSPQSLTVQQMAEALRECLRHVYPSYDDEHAAVKQATEALAAYKSAITPESGQAADAPGVGWRFERVSDGDVRVYDPSGETWLLRSGQDGFFGFAHRLVDALAASDPQPVAVALEPLADAEARKLTKLGPVHAPDGFVKRSAAGYRQELQEAAIRGIRIAERAHGIGHTIKEQSNG